jgi:hypothetical protein
MNKQIFDNYYNSRFELAIVVNYDRTFNDDPTTRKSDILVLVRYLDKYPILKDLVTVRQIIEIDDERLNEEEVSIKNHIIHLYSKKITSKIIFMKNIYITQETSLVDVKTYLGGVINVFPIEIYLEIAENRKPIQNYISGMNEINLLVSEIVLGNLDGEETPIDDMLLKNIKAVDNVYCFNLYTINDYIDNIKQTRITFITQNDKKLGKLLHNFWTKIESSEIVKRLKDSKFSEDFIETNKALLEDYKKVIEQESEYNDMFWKVEIDDAVFKHIGIYFNSFILENKENKRERTLDIYSIFKFFELNQDIPFTRYSYGNQISQKIVKIYEDFYSIENIKYLDKWSTMLSYKDIPSNCVQWKGFYIDTELNKLEYDFILFNDFTYQIRFYQQKINLDNMETFLEYIKVTVLEKIKTILYSIGMSMVLNKLELGKNIYFIFSKLEINVVLNKELEIGKLQNILNKSNFLFDRESDLMSNEFVNLEFKKVNNYTRSDQIFKFINYYVTQNRLTEMNEMAPVIKQVMSKYNKNVMEATEILYSWIRRFVDLGSQQNKKIKISKNIGLDIVGKQLGNNICNFYMSNVIGLDDIYTFYYYLIILLNWSQNKENNRLYAQLLGKKVDDSVLHKLQAKKDEEGEVDVLGDIDFDALLEADEENATEEVADLVDRLSVHSDMSEESDAKGIDKQELEMPNEEEIFDELKPIVDGSSYYINRLKMMDKEVYDYKIDDKFGPYSRMAMPNDSRQPIVLSGRQMKKIVDKYGDDKNVYGGINQNVELYKKDYKKPSYDIKYRNLHYICPKVWCMLDQMPYYMTDLLETSGKGFIPATFIEDEVLKNPKNVVCPDCKNGIWDNGTRKGTLLIAQDNLKRQAYPGFFTGEKHPKGICMVTCFKTANQQKKIEECTGDKKVVKKEKKISNEKYILKGDKYGRCNYGRFCVLPSVLHEWMNRDFGNYKNERTVLDEYIGFLRAGILKDNENYYQSFEKTIQYLLRDFTFSKSTVEFRQHLVDKLKSNPDIRLIFKKCRKGSLYLYFEKDIENLYSYIINTISLQSKFILPILSYPGVLIENGINFFIIQEDNGKIYIDCEYFNFEYDESRLSANNMFIYSYSTGESYKKIFYEPIIRVQQRSKIVHITTDFIGVSKDSIFEDLFKYVKKECTQTEDPLITSAKVNKISEEEYFLAKTSSNKIIQSLSKLEEYQIIFQYVNTYNQTEGLILKEIESNKSYYIPFTPLEILDDIKILTVKKMIKLQSFSDTLKFLEDITEKANIPYSPYFYTVTTDELMKTGIYTLTGEWIPTLYIAETSDEPGKLRKWSIPKDIWVKEKILQDDRTVHGKDRDMKKFNYEKLRFELSKLVNKSDDFKTMIIQKMRNYKETNEIDVKTTVRDDLISEISEYLRNHIVTPGIIGEWNKKDIFNYCSNNEEIDQCNSSSMCTWNGKKNECRMIINPEWYWKFISRIVDEVLVNVNKRKEILDEYRKEMDIPENEIIFYNRDDIDQYLQKYDFNLENKKFIKHPLEHFDYSNPKQKIHDEIPDTTYTYNLPKYIRKLFDTYSSNSRVKMSDKLGLFFNSEKSSNYFFKTMDELIKLVYPAKKPFILSRIIIATQIRAYSEPDLLLERYKSLSESDSGEIYRRFVAMKSIEDLVEYVKLNSWASEIDLELISNYFIKSKIRFIIINDIGSIDRDNPFIYLSDHIKELTNDNIEQYRFVIFSKHKNLINMISKKDTGSPLFTVDEIPFLSVWLEGQREFESSL